PLARTPRRREREPFAGLLHFWDRVLCAVVIRDAARPGRLRVPAPAPEAPMVRLLSSTCPSETGRCLIPRLGASSRMDLFVVSRGIMLTVRGPAARFPPGGG